MDVLHVYEVNYYKPRQTRGRPNKMLITSTIPWSRENILRIFHAGTEHRMETKSVQEVTPSGRKEIK